MLVVSPIAIEFSIETRNQTRDFDELIWILKIGKKRTYPLICIGVSLIYDLSSQLISVYESHFRDICQFSHFVVVMSEKWMKSFSISLDMRWFRLSRKIIKFVWTSSSSHVSYISWYDTIYAIVSFTHSPTLFINPLRVDLTIAHFACEHFFNLTRNFVQDDSQERIFRQFFTFQFNENRPNMKWRRINLHICHGRLGRFEKKCLSSQEKEKSFIQLKMTWRGHEQFWEWRKKLEK